MKSCKQCGKEFEPDNPKGVFCSAKCRQKDYRNSINGKLKKLDELTKAAKATPLGEKIMQEIKSNPPTLKVRDISVTGEIMTTHEIKPLSDYELSTAKERIKQLEYEIANPGNPVIGKRSYIAIRETELKELKNKIQ